MEVTIYYTLLVILIVQYFFDNWLEWLNLRQLKDTLPNELQGIYDQDKYSKSVAYEKANTHFSFISGSFSFLAILSMLLFGGFAFVDQIAWEITSNLYLRNLIFFGLLMFVSDFFSIPFQYYQTFVIEAQFGFNKSTFGTFISDKIKGWGMTALLGGGILSFLLWSYQSTGNWFFLIFMSGVTTLTVFITLFYSHLIVPLFNKLTPLPPGELADALHDFAQQHQFSIKNIFILDGSKRSSKANAYFSGFGSQKRIVLYDTLINDLTTKEIVAVLAHETGHSKKKHVLWNMVISLIQTAIMVSLLMMALGYPAFSLALGAKTPSFYLNLLAFGLLYTPIAELLGIFTHKISRKFEYQADGYVVKSGLGNELISGLKRLSVNNLSNLQPHPWYVFFHYSHPTLIQRISAIKTWLYKT